MRTNARYGPLEDRPEPPAKTHEQVVRDARANERHAGPMNAAPHHQSGILELCPLVFLPFFNLVWDFLPCLMHILAGWWKRNFVNLLKAKRAPACPKPRAGWTKAQNNELAADHARIVEQQQSWEMSKEDVLEVDQRCRSLGGSSGWIRSNLEMFGHTSSFKCHDWLTVIHGAGEYLFQNLFPEDVEQALFGFIAVCRKLLTVTSAVDEPNACDLTQLKLEVVESLASLAAVLPPTEMPLILHLLVHVPDSIHRWSSVRNYWAFFPERVVGWMIRFVHNRDLAVENIVKAMVRRQTILFAPGNMIKNLLAKLPKCHLNLPLQSSLFLVKDLLARKRKLPGSYALELTPSRRNDRHFNLPTSHREAMGRYCHSLKIKAPDYNECRLMTAGVHLNGREFKESDFVEIMKPARSESQAGSLDTILVGKVTQFMVFPASSRNEPPIVFLRLLEYPIDEKRSCYYVHPKDWQVKHWALAHIDHVIAKMHIAPHVEDEQKICSVRMWTAR
jgi:hypothetical protein